MTRVPLVSAITPFLDAERFLADAIESVLAQHYSNWELLLVNDGSTDGSTEIARNAAQTYAGVRYLEHPRHENRGKNASRNLAIEQSRGEYITFLDADDVWFPDTLSRQVALLEGHRDAAMVYGSADWWRSWREDGRVTRDWCDDVGSKVPRPDSLHEPPVLLTLFLRDGGAVPCLHTLTLRADVVRNAGGFEYLLDDLYEDQVLIAKICLEWPVFVTASVLGRYRQHDGQSCARADAATEAAARTTFLNWLADRINERGIDDPELLGALGDAIVTMAAAETAS
jgi:glycosyltransferase involved in cell wall biosynthesis